MSVEEQDRVICAYVENAPVSLDQLEDLTIRCGDHDTPSVDIQTLRDFCAHAATPRDHALRLVRLGYFAVLCQITESDARDEWMARLVDNPPSKPEQLCAIEIQWWHAQQYERWVASIQDARIPEPAPDSARAWIQRVARCISHDEVQATLTRERQRWHLKREWMELGSGTEWEVLVERLGPDRFSEVTEAALTDIIDVVTLADNEDAAYSVAAAICCVQDANTHCPDADTLYMYMWSFAPPVPKPMHLIVTPHGELAFYDADLVLHAGPVEDIVHTWLSIMPVEATTYHEIDVEEPGVMDPDMVLFE